MCVHVCVHVCVYERESARERERERIHTTQREGRPMLSQRRTEASTTHTPRMTPTTEHMRIVRCIDSCTWFRV